MNQEQHCQLENNDERYITNEAMGNSEVDKTQEEEEVASGISIVRDSTPRPLPYDMMLSDSGQLYRSQEGEAAPLPTFPTKAPSAPPLPEELGEREEDASMISSVPLADRQKPLTMEAQEAQEFVWLFEYGLEMDNSILNSPERLDGLALLYGPAVLKGYSIVLSSQGSEGEEGPTLAALVVAEDANAEVWGVLYRIPRRITERTRDEPSLLDTIHGAIPPQNFFKARQVSVHEIYRDRDIPCVTYIASDRAHQQLRLVPIEQWHGDRLFIQRLTAIAKKQKLPESYLSLYLSATASATTEKVTAVRVEQNTDPLPVLAKNDDVKLVKADNNVTLPTSEGVQEMPLPLSRVRDGWLIAFAVYLVLLLLMVMACAVLRGLGLERVAFSRNGVMLGVPWLVMVYGLLGGCISSMVTLGRLRLSNPPIFVLITWFARPYIGAVLAGLTYLLLTSGFFVLGGNVGRHMTFFLFAGALAGMCEGWIFFWWQKEKSF